jgi:hypothetical protein
MWAIALALGGRRPFGSIPGGYKTSLHCMALAWAGDDSTKTIMIAWDRIQKFCVVFQHLTVH